MKKMIAIVVGILMLTGCFAGCTSPQVSPATVPAKTLVATQPPTAFPVGVEWRLTSYLDRANVLTPVTGVKPVTALFGSSGKLSGSGGCNQYSATSSVSGTGITISQPATTLMACEESVMQQESMYLADLAKASTYSNTPGDTLTFYDASGAVILVYKRPVDASGGQPPIVGVWDLFSYNNGKGGIETVIIGSTTTADFGADGKLAGSAGCNQYSATYTTSGSKGITITQPITTLMACENNLMQQETQYLSLLQKAAKYEISGDQLTLFDSTGTKILIYKKHVGTPATIVGLWNLFSYNNGKGGIETVIIGSTTTADFGADRKLAGSAGCNQYSATYTTSGAKGITITQPASTRMACEDNVMQQETQYLSLLPKASTYNIAGDQLTLFNSTGTKILIYTPAPSGATPGK
jgi:heat shock protein HslJ